MALQKKGLVAPPCSHNDGERSGTKSILRAAITARSRSLVPLGAGTIVGVKGTPLIGRPMAVWHHLQRFSKYDSKTL